MNEYSAKLLPKMAKNANDFAFKTSNYPTNVQHCVTRSFTFSQKCDKFDD